MVKTEPNKDFREIYREESVKSLEKLIPEMMEQREKHFRRRLIITFVVIFVLFIIGLIFIFDYLPLYITLILSAVFSIVVIFISYIISSFVFGHASHEALIIEKMITEYNVLTKGHDDSMDQHVEIGKLRDYL